MTQSHPPVDWSVHEAVRKDRDRLARKVRELEDGLRALHMQLSDERRSIAAKIQREAQQQARQYLFGEH